MSSEEEHLDKIESLLKRRDSDIAKWKGDPLQEVLGRKVLPALEASHKTNPDKNN